MFSRSFSSHSIFHIPISTIIPLCQTATIAFPSVSSRHFGKRGAKWCMQ